MLILQPQETKITQGSFIDLERTQIFSEKTSYSLILTEWVVRNFNFSKSFAYILNEWSQIYPCRKSIRLRAMRLQQSFTRHLSRYQDDWGFGISFNSPITFTRKKWTVEWKIRSRWNISRYIKEDKDGKKL